MHAENILQFNIQPEAVPATAQNQAAPHNFQQPGQAGELKQEDTEDASDFESINKKKKLFNLNSQKKKPIPLEIKD